MLQKRLLDAHIIWCRSGRLSCFRSQKRTARSLTSSRREVLLRHAGKRTRSAQLPTGYEISASMIHQRLHSAIHRLFLPNGSVVTATLQRN
jgi:hypothetical protein